MPYTPSSDTNSTPKDYLNLAQTMLFNGEDPYNVFGGLTMDDDFPSNLNTFQPGDLPLQHWRAAPPLQPEFSAGPFTATSSTAFGKSTENSVTTAAVSSGLDSIPLEWTMTSSSDSLFHSMGVEELNGLNMSSLPTDFFLGPADLTDLPSYWSSFAPDVSVTVGRQAPSYAAVCPDHAENIMPVPSDDTMGLDDSVHALQSEDFHLL
ncbi:hypothetical protein EIK77_008801 [Talaromyces pinophilus]|nr:hypothetical protein EIK77_008801 [Talaromyces pinophilus]